MCKILLITLFCIYSNIIFADGNIITNVRENVSTVSQNSNVNTGIDLGNNSDNQIVIGNKETKTEERKISGYSKISITGNFDVVANCNNEGTLKITAESNILPLIESRISGDTLIISIKKQIETHNKIELSINSPQIINEIDIIGVNVLKYDNINSGNFLFKSTSDDANVYLSGSSSSVTFKIIGDSDINASELKCETVKINITGDSSIKISEVKDIKVNITGDGKVLYKGNPKISKQLLGGTIENY